MTPASSEPCTGTSSITGPAGQIDRGRRFSPFPDHRRSWSATVHVFDLVVCETTVVFFAKYSASVLDRSLRSPKRKLRFSTWVHRRVPVEKTKRHYWTEEFNRSVTVRRNRCNVLADTVGTRIAAPYRPAVSRSVYPDTTLVRGQSVFNPLVSICSVAVFHCFRTNIRPCYGARPARPVYTCRLTYKDTIFPGPVANVIDRDTTTVKLMRLRNMAQFFYQVTAD